MKESSIKCTNPDCHAENPANAKFCRKCGQPLIERGYLPFHLAHPEYHLKPISEYPELIFWFNKPDYVEDYYESNSDYYYIVKNGKFGIIYWKREKHWYGDTVDYHRVVSCQYDRIDKEEEHFICYRGSERLFMDLKGNILK